MNPWEGQVCRDCGPVDVLFVENNVHVERICAKCHEYMGFVQRTQEVLERMVPRPPPPQMEMDFGRNTRRGK